MGLSAQLLGIYALQEVKTHLLFCLDACGDNLHAVLNDFFNMF